MAIRLMDPKGEIETETFSADMMVIKFIGKNIHPGYAKGHMINSIKIASAFYRQFSERYFS